MNNKTKLLALAAVAATIAACNGGGSSSSSSTPIYAFITSPNNNSYIECQVGASGIESSTCALLKPTGTGALSVPNTIVINNGMSFTTNMGNNTITQCGSGSCSNLIPAGLNAPQGLAIGNGFVYITNNGDGNGTSYTQCNINSSGIESSTCATVAPTGAGTMTGPSGIAVDSNFAYILSNESSYTQCNLGVSGIESNTCNTGSFSAGNNIRGIAVNNGYAYVTNGGSNNIIQCNVNSNGIESNTCTTITPTGSGVLALPSGITIYESTAYIINGTGAGSYTQCPVTGNGIESGSCITTPFTIDGTGNFPYSIAFTN